MGTVFSDSGATHHNVNNMVLFTNNTRNLAEMRNDIYTFYYERKEPVSRGRIGILFDTALAQYKKEFYSSDLEGEDLNDYNAYVTFTDEQKQEFITLMVAKYDSWKFDKEQFEKTENENH